MMLIFFIYSMLLRVASVNAVFMEDAFVSDWQIESIGSYTCVMGDQNHLIVVSDLESTSLISFLNDTTGDILFRYPLEFKVDDAMMLPNHSQFVLKDDDGENHIFDSITGFIMEDRFETEAFTSSCNPSNEDVLISGNSLRLLDADSGLEVTKVDLKDSFHDLKYFETDNLGMVKFLYSTNDGQYHFEVVENGMKTKEWHRDESMSDITSFIFLDIPDEDFISMEHEILAEQNFINIWDAYTYRVSQNWGRLKSFLKENNYSPGKIITKIMKMDSESLQQSNDAAFGLAKYLIVNSKMGFLSAIDVRNGTKIWSRQTGLSDVVFIDSLTKKKEILLISKDGSFLQYDVNNITQPVEVKKDQLEISNVDTILKLDEGRYLLQSDTTSSKVLHLDEYAFEPLNTVVTTHDNKGVYGSILKNKHLKQTWKIEMDEFEEIVAFTKRENVTIPNIGVTLGNRTVLYKYLYPHLASYVVSNKKEQRIYVNLIDTVTGELLHTQFHEQKVDLTSPVNIVFGENWFVYTYFDNEPIPEQRLVVVELYESLQADEKITINLQEYDPFKNLIKPAIISNAYYFPEVIERMTIAQTKYHITQSAIVLELESGQITYLLKSILNARRQPESKMTDSDKKEFMAMPYISTIPLNDHFIVSHSRGLLIGDNGHLTSISTNLESTSIICDIGHDIFCTKIYPSGKFDTMSSTFEKGKLLATILGLFVLCYLLRPSVESAKLKSQWLVRS